MSVPNLEQTATARPETLPIGDVGVLVLKWDFLHKTPPGGASEPKYVTDAWPPSLDPDPLDYGYGPRGPGQENDRPFSAQPKYSIYPSDGVSWITELLQVEGLTVLARTDIAALTEEQIDGMYPGKQSKPWFGGYKDSLTDTPATALLVGGVGVAERLELLKGGPDERGSWRWLLSEKRALPASQLEGYLQEKYRRQQSEIGAVPLASSDYPDVKVDDAGVDVGDGYGSKVTLEARMRRRRLAYDLGYVSTPDLLAPLPREDPPMDQAEWQKVHDSVYRDDSMHSPDPGFSTISTIQALFPKSIREALLATHPQLRHWLDA